MSALRIYDSEGYEYRNGERTPEQSSKIQDAFLARMRVRVDTDRGAPELVCFFRARETQGGRAEQFYAHYQGDRLDTLFEDFNRELIQLIENQWGMSLDTRSEDTEAFRLLTSVAAPQRDRLPGDAFRHEVIKNRLERNRRLAFGVRDTKTAMQLLKWYISSSPAQSVVISEQLRDDLTESADIVFQPGAGRGLSPLGNTKQELQSGRSELEGKLLQETVNSIKSNVQRLKQQTSYSDQEIRESVQSSVPTLKAPRQTSHRQKQGMAGTDDDDSALGQTAILAGIAVIVFAVAAIAAMAFLGIGPLFGGDSDAAPDGPQDIEELAVTVDIDNEQFVLSGFNDTDATLSIEGQRSGHEGSAEIDSQEIPFEALAENESMIPSDMYTISAGDLNVTLVDQNGGEHNSTAVPIATAELETDEETVRFADREYQVTATNTTTINRTRGYVDSVELRRDGAVVDVFDSDGDPVNGSVDDGQYRAEIETTLLHGEMLPVSLEESFTDPAVNQTSEVDLYILNGGAEFVSVDHEPTEDGEPLEYRYEAVIASEVYDDTDLVLQKEADPDDEQVESMRQRDEEGGVRRIESTFEVDPNTDYELKLIKDRDTEDPVTLATEDFPTPVADDGGGEDETDGDESGGNDNESGSGS